MVVTNFFFINCENLLKYNVKIIIFNISYQKVLLKGAEEVARKNYF